MMLACSSPMVPGDTLTKKAELLGSWGYDAIAVFQPYAEWDDGVRRELATLESRTGVRPVEFVLIDEVYGHAMSTDRRPSCPVPGDVPRGRRRMRRAGNRDRDRVRVRRPQPAAALRPLPGAR